MWLWQRLSGPGWLQLPAQTSSKVSPSDESKSCMSQAQSFSCVLKTDCVLRSCFWPSLNQCDGIRRFSGNVIWQLRHLSFSAPLSTWSIGLSWRMNRAYDRSLSSINGDAAGESGFRDQHVEHKVGRTWVQRTDVGPCASQKWARENYCDLEVSRVQWDYLARFGDNLLWNPLLGIFKCTLRISRALWYYINRLCWNSTEMMPSLNPPQHAEEELMSSRKSNGHCSSKPILKVLF